MKFQTYGVGVQPIQLPTTSTTFVNGQNSVGTGWGLTSNDGDLASVLQVRTVCNFLLNNNEFLFRSLLFL